MPKYAIAYENPSLSSIFNSLSSLESRIYSSINDNIALLDNKFTLDRQSASTASFAGFKQL